jgi:hypothetical protein
MRFLIFPVLAVISCPAQAGWFSYDNYDDCMLGRMKGQTQMMYGSADKACKKEFKVEFPTSVYSTKYEWDAGTVRIVEADDEYEITKGSFAFSSKPCDEAKDQDFMPPTVLKFEHGEARAYVAQIISAKCMRAIGFSARYK